MTLTASASAGSLPATRPSTAGGSVRLLQAPRSAASQARLAALQAPPMSYKPPPRSTGLHLEDATTPPP